MKRKIIVTILFFTFFSIGHSFGADIISNASSSAPQIFFPDTLNHKAEIDIKQTSKIWLDYIFPSILAFIVAIFTSLIGWRANNKQIKSSRESIKEQIQSAKEIAELDFRKQVLSANRVKWIEDLRNKVSLLISTMIMIDPSNDNSLSKLELIIELSTSILLMLNPNDPRDSEFIGLMNDLPVLILKYPKDTTPKDIGEMRKKIINISKQILKSEWQKVKEGK